MALKSIKNKPPLHVTLKVIEGNVQEGSNFKAKVPGNLKSWCDAWSNISATRAFAN